MRSDIWQLIEKEKLRMMAGITIECSLFGKVSAEFSEGRLVGKIPHWLQQEANAHGFKVVGVDHERNTYTLAAN